MIDYNVPYVEKREESTLKTIEKNNLYDSVINEIEKIAYYEKSLSRFNNDEMAIVKLSKFDVDIMGFILTKNQEILSDKILRSFVNISHAVERCYDVLKISLINDNKFTIVTYTPEVIDFVDRATNSIIQLRTFKSLYDAEMNKNMNSMSIKEYVDLQYKEFHDYIHTNDFNEITTSVEEFKNVIEKHYEEVNKFMNIMKCELESKHYLATSTTVIKHVFSIVIMTSMLVETFHLG